MRLLWILLLFCVCFSAVSYADHAHTAKSPPPRQESSGATDWIASWRTCSGDGAVKRDGTLWQFGGVGGCHWGQIDLAPTHKKYIYHLRGRRIGSGFAGARIINGGYRVYAIKRNGTLWGWGEGLGDKPRLLSRSHDWVDFRVKWAGNGCCAHDVGMQKDGTLWRFPEKVEFTHTNPMPYLKMIGRQKGWDRVILDCCSIYAMRKDGTLWQNDGLGSKTLFRQIHYPAFCKAHPGLCAHFGKMPHHTIYSSEGNEVISVDRSARAGTLWMKPELCYEE